MIRIFGFLVLEGSFCQIFIYSYPKKFENFNTRFHKIKSNPSAQCARQVTQGKNPAHSNNQVYHNPDKNNSS
jgi:hypothetical protein